MKLYLTYKLVSSARLWQSFTTFFWRFVEIRLPDANKKSTTKKTYNSVHIRFGRYFFSCSSLGNVNCTSHKMQTIDMRTTNEIQNVNLLTISFLNYCTLGRLFDAGAL